MAKLEDTAARFAKELSRTMGALLRSRIDVEPMSVTQQYAARLRQPGDEAPEVYFAELVGRGGEHCGLVTVPAEAGAAWVARLLGGSPADDDRELSALETELLSEILRALAQGISAASESADGPALTQRQEVSKGHLVLPAEDSDEYCKFVFRLSAWERQSVVFFVLAAEAVDQILGVRHAPSGRTPEQTRTDLLGHVRCVPVSATLRLGHASVPMRDVMDLEPGDVMLLQQRIDQPAEVVLQGKVVLLADPVTCQGRYGAQIVAWADSDSAGP